MTRQEIVNRGMRSALGNTAQHVREGIAQRDAREDAREVARVQNLALEGERARTALERVRTPGGAA